MEPDRLSKRTYLFYVSIRVCRIRVLDLEMLCVPRYSALASVDIKILIAKPRYEISVAPFQSCNVLTNIAAAGLKLLQRTNLLVDPPQFRVFLLNSRDHAVFCLVIGFTLKTDHISSFFEHLQSEVSVQVFDAKGKGDAEGD